MESENNFRINDDDIVWETFKSAKGKEYQVGYSKHLDKDAGENNSLESAKKSFGIDVNWQVGDKNWKNADPHVVNTAAITRYRVYAQQGIYDYIIEFTNRVNYDYYFYDRTGDHYRCNCHFNRDHYVKYNSHNPDIIKITGS
ncbi:MAG: hypothetical protein WCC64_16590 [Aliidongia sp.]